MNRFLPDGLRNYVFLAEMDTADPFAVDLFRAKFGSEPAGFGRHFVAWIRGGAPSTYRVAGYSHVWIEDGAGYLGGVATDGDALRTLGAAEQEQLRRCDGLYVCIGRAIFARYRDELDAVFGYCGNGRALERNLTMGFERIESQPYLIAHFPRDLRESRRQSLIERAVAVGPF